MCLSNNAEETLIDGLGEIDILNRHVAGTAQYIPLSHARMRCLVRFISASQISAYSCRRQRFNPSTARLQKLYVRDMKI